jgi:hypothetical protein
VEKTDSIVTKAISLLQIVVFVLGFILISNVTKMSAQTNCDLDTIPPFCYVTSYVIQGDEEGGVLFFPEIAADICSELSSSVFFHIAKGKIMHDGEFIENGEHTFLNIVSDENANFTNCRFTVNVHRGEYKAQEFNPIAHRTIRNEMIHYPLGSLSAKWESGHLGPGAISSGYGDPGGASYGLFQLSSNTGTLQDYLNSEGLEYMPILKKHTPGTREFNQNWKMLADLDKKIFSKTQYDFINRTHYRRFCRKIENHFQLDINEFSSVIKDVIWSTAVQHGPANTVFENAFEDDEIFVMTEEEIINRIYNERLRKADGKLVYFPNVSRLVENGLINRYHKEKEMALSRLLNMEVAASRE